MASFSKNDGKWQSGPQTGLRKRHGLQGPIDDAFQDPFLCVLPTSAPWNLASHVGPARFAEFQKNFAKYMRGDVRRKSDKGVTLDDLDQYNLVLFGDPGSNQMIGGLVDRLPITWTRDKLEIGGRQFDPKKHMPVLIYPSPYNPNRYVVLNSGHTFGENGVQGTNALLYPRLGDWAVIDTAKGEAVAAGIFDENWRVR